MLKLKLQYFGHLMWRTDSLEKTLMLGKIEGKRKRGWQRIDSITDSIWCWRRLLRVPWTARRSNQSIIKEISPEYSLEGLMLKLKLQYFGHQMWRTDSLRKRVMLWKTEGRRGRRWDGWTASLTLWTWVWVNSGSWWWTGRPGVLQCMGSQRVRHDWATELNRPEISQLRYSGVSARMMER